MPRPSIGALDLQPVLGQASLEAVGQVHEEEERPMRRMDAEAQVYSAPVFGRWLMDSFGV